MENENNITHAERWVEEERKEKGEVLGELEGEDDTLLYNILQSLRGKKCHFNFLLLSCIYDWLVQCDPSGLGSKGI